MPLGLKGFCLKLLHPVENTLSLGESNGEYVRPSAPTSSFVVDVLATVTNEDAPLDRD